MKKIKSAARKIGIALVGFPLVILGLILIPLPGPGILVTVAGLFVLSLEFEWAEKHLNYFRSKLKKLIDASRKKID